jgi:hypothetical protein
VASKVNTQEQERNVFELRASKIRGKASRGDSLRLLYVCTLDSGINGSWIWRYKFDMS